MLVVRLKLLQNVDNARIVLAHLFLLPVPQETGLVQLVVATADSKCQVGHIVVLDVVVQHDEKRLG